MTRRPSGPPAFSVVMPAYNTAETIEDAIASVLAQTESDFELIVIDDGSTDETRARVETFEDDRVHLIAQPNKGAAAARNVGVRAGTGKLVAFIDSDDLWLPSFLDGMRERFRLDPALGLCYTDAWILDPNTRRIGIATAMQWQRPPMSPPRDPERFMNELLQRNFVYSAAVVPHVVLDEVGEFDETLNAAIDYDMWLRIVARGHPAGNLPGLHAVYSRNRPGSISSDRARTFESLRVVYDKVASDPELTPQLKAQARKRGEAVERERTALERRPTIDSLWRARLRPAIVRLRNSVTGRDRWRSEPPSELVEAFPRLLGKRPRAAGETE